MTRTRVKQSLERTLTEPCPYCSGTGTIKSSSTVCYEILTEVKKVGPDLDGLGVLLRVNPDIARALRDEERGVLRDMKQMLGKDVIVKADVHLHHEQFDVMSIGG
jgi:ribonuclease G